jgi:type II restriction enzyme
MQRGIRIKKPKKQLWRQGSRRRLQREMSASLCKQQSKSFAAQLRRKNAERHEHLFVVPKHFFVLEIIEQRKPLAPTARRAGWVGSHILLSQIPESGKIYVIRAGQIESKELVLSKWRQTLFLRDQTQEGRGWLIEVMKCIESLGKQEFQIDDVYAFEGRLSRIYPGNQNVRPKIRQQLQFLRDRGYLDFMSRGYYRLRTHDLN